MYIKSNFRRYRLSFTLFTFSSIHYSVRAPNLRISPNNSWTIHYLREEFAVSKVHHYRHYSHRSLLTKNIGIFIYHTYTSFESLSVIIALIGGTAHAQSFYLFTGWLSDVPKSHVICKPTGRLTLGWLSFWYLERWDMTIVHIIHKFRG